MCISIDCIVSLPCTVFPTHRLYLVGLHRYINGHPSIFSDTFLFLLLLLSLTLFLSSRDNETIHDQLTIGKSPLTLNDSYGSFCVLENCRHSHRQPPVFPIRSFICATISTTRCPQLPHLSHTSATLAQYLATFRPFWRLFFHNRYILTNLVTLKKKNLSYRSVGRCLQYCPESARSDSPGICSEQCAAEKQHFQLAAADTSSVNHLQNIVY